MSGLGSLIQGDSLNLGNIPMGPITNSLLNAMGIGDPATSYMVSNLGGLATQYLMDSGVFSPIAQGTAAGMGGIAAGTGMEAIEQGATGLTGAVFPLGTMVAGQNDFTNPYSGYLGTIPFIGTILGGLLEGIIGKGDPMQYEPVSPDYRIMLQRMRMDPRWGWQGNWKEEFDPTTKAGLGKETPKFGRPTDPEALQWWAQNWGPAASQLYSPYGTLTGPGIGFSGIEGEQPVNFAPEIGSPLEKWWNILKARDETMGVKGKDRDIQSRFYAPGGAIPMGEVDETQQSTYHGTNPFAGLSSADLEFYYQPGGVLDYMDTLLSQTLGKIPKSVSHPSTTISTRKG